MVFSLPPSLFGDEDAKVIGCFVKSVRWNLVSPCTLGTYIGKHTHTQKETSVREFESEFSVYTLAYI